MSSNESLRRSSRIKARIEETSNAMKKELESIEENIRKPVELFSNDDVSGKVLYKFQTPSKKNAMTQKANLCRTPVSTKKQTVVNEPRVLLERLHADDQDLLKTDKKNFGKRDIQRNLELVSSESESISEPSDYVPSEDDTDDKSSGSECTDYSNDEENEIVTKVQKKKFMFQSNLLSTPKRINTANKPVVIHNDFHMKTDEYFVTQSEKVITSDHTLERLRNSRLTKEKLEQLLTNQNFISTKHKKNIYSLTESYSKLFPMWYFIMEQGYTVLLYGLGSKRCLINNFYKSVSYHPSLVVNGFFPSLTTKDILDGIIVDLLGLSCPTNTSECVDLIEKTLKKNPEDRLYLLIHNIDGIMLRSNKVQDVLSCLAKISNLCILASVDHINAPLLWDHTKRAKYNFFWWDTTTFLSYQEETSYESSLMVQQSGSLALSSLHNVFLSLNSNAKSIYILLAKYQLSNSSNMNFTGMAFKDLYRTAREGFLVSSDLALRAQLTEFIDHKLVKVKRNIDSVEHLVIPLSNVLLKQFLEEHEP
ncbi:origin recognition complex subunit 2 isoform X2 [Calliopsis andreniformis]|uniref:origin recognition complex subunit 2 isoform X2 n=1 Tax=Calliopsis andreniformis TaxID=337506 RepID=UPI003FCDFCF5